MLRRWVRPNLHERDAGGQEFLHIGSPDAACDDRCFPADGVMVKPHFDKTLFERRLLPVEFFMQDPGMGRDYDVLPGILMKLSDLGIRNNGTQFHVAFRVTDPGRGTEQHRQAELLGDGKSGGDHVMRFLHTCRVEAGEPGEMGITPGVLFVLGTVRERVIGAHDDKTAGHPGIGTRHEWVGSDIEADMLHGADRPEPAPCGSKGIFESNFLVHRPFHMTGQIFLHTEHIDHFR